MTSDLGKLLFRFAVIADTHVTEQEGVSSSPWPVNRLANARCREVVRQLNASAPAFVLHLGDLVHPVPAQRTYVDAAERFHELMKDLACELYLTPGNHDVGDKPLDWMPVGVVDDAGIALYEQHFGRPFYSFDREGIHFVVINAQIVNSGLPSEPAQQAWLERDLEDHHGRRIFFCTHYPPYVSNADEAPSYDNIDEPGRSWLLALIAEHGVEVVFAGHVHNFWYDRRGATDFYILPSTALVRQDYSELYRIEPGPENGRDDAPKLGYMLVDVHERGHVAHTVRTYGEGAEALSPRTSRASRLPLVHTRTNAAAPVGVDLRYPWAESMEVAASGGVDEFERKLVRNDYPLLALWEMGVRKLRVPLHDLANPDIRQRMRLLVRLGHRFAAYSYDVPAGALLDALKEHHELLTDWELVLNWDHAADRLARVLDLKRACAGLRVTWSKLRRRQDAERAGAPYVHMISHGFTLGEVDEVAAFLRLPLAADAVDSVVVRVVLEDSAWEAITAARAMAEALGVAACVHVRLAASTPAVVLNDDLAAANRVAETLAAALAGPDIDVFLDTFNDVDRSYFVRTGLVDRRYNPRLAGRVLRHLHAAAGAYGRGVFRPLFAEAFAGYGIRVLVSGADPWFLVLPQTACTLQSLPSWPGKRSAAAGSGIVVDLDSGDVHDATWSASAADELALGAAICCTAPMLVVVHS